LPIANQLEIAIVKIKEHIKTIIYARAETNRMQEVFILTPNCVRPIQSAPNVKISSIRRHEKNVL